MNEKFEFEFEFEFDSLLYDEIRRFGGLAVFKECQAPKLSLQIEKQNHHAQLTSFFVSFVKSLQFCASSCDFCISSFPFVVLLRLSSVKLGLNSHVCGPGWKVCRMRGGSLYVQIACAAAFVSLNNSSIVSFCCFTKFRCWNRD